MGGGESYTSELQVFLKSHRLSNINIQARGMGIVMRFQDYFKASYTIDACGARALGAEGSRPEARVC